MPTPRSLRSQARPGPMGYPAQQERPGAPSKRIPGRRARVISVIAGAVTLVCVVTLGWVTSAAQRAARSASTVSSTVTLADRWASGSRRTWSTTVAAGAEILTAGDKVITVERSSSTSTEATLTAYTTTSSQATRAWSATLDLSQGTVDTDRTDRTAYEFLVWGGTLIHGTTLINLKDGSTSTAPWPPDRAPRVADDIVLACDQSSCSAWRSGSTTALWELTFEDSTQYTNSYLDVFVRGQERYVVVGFWTVVNLDTGQEVALDRPGNTSSIFIVAKDGWVVGSHQPNGTYRMRTYTVDGQANGQYSMSLVYNDTQRPIFDYSGALTLAEIQSLFTQNTDPTGTFYGENHCAVSMTLRGGQSITFPVLRSNSPDNTLGSDSTRCPFTYHESPGGSLLSLGPRDALGINSVVLVYDTRTGERIGFEGPQTEGGAVLLALSPVLMVGYDPASGALHGYTPR